MRTLTYFVATSVDGYIAAPDGAFDAFPTDGDHLRLIADCYPETLPAPAREAFGIDAPNRRFDTVVMGRATYEPARAAGLVSPYPHLDQVVFSRTLGSVADPAVRVIDDDPVTVVRRLKNRPGLGIWLCGGSALAGQLHAEVDELIVKIYPIVMGDGLRLFSHEHSPQRYSLVASEISTNGVAFMTYRRAHADAA